MVNKAKGWGNEEQEYSPWVSKVLIGACVLLIIAAWASGWFKADEPQTPSPSPSVTTSAVPS